MGVEWEAGTGGSQSFLFLNFGCIWLFCSRSMYTTTEKATGAWCGWSRTRIEEKPLDLANERSLVASRRMVSWVCGDQGRTDERHGYMSELKSRLLFQEVGWEREGERQERAVGGQGVKTRLAAFKEPP